VHKGHLNILSEASKLGRVVVGVLSDSAISSYKRVPYMSYADRSEIISSLRFVDKVVIQDSLSYASNLREIRPEYVVHGDDWREGPQKQTREEVVAILQEYGGKLVEIPYTENVSSTRFIEQLEEENFLPTIRLSRLRRLLEVKGTIRAIEAHSGLTAAIVENSRVGNRTFDAIWLSSLTDATLRGKPDIEVVGLTPRIHSIGDMVEVTRKPFIFDGDTGGMPEHFHYMVQNLEMAGVSAVIIEDKIGLKRNSLFGTEVKQNQATKEEFAEKIRVGVLAKRSSDFMIIARIESLIFDKPTSDALDRAFHYIDAGADGIMIHSSKKNGEDILDFMYQFRNQDKITPLVVVPSAFPSLGFDALAEAGANIVIYANQLLRAAYPAMVFAAEAILENNGSLSIENELMSIKEILRLIPGENLAN